jgi:purine-binding chemotaxis protein CheW
MGSTRFVVRKASARDRRADATSGRLRLTFTLKGDAYALDIFHVTEILEQRPLTIVPMTPDFIRGVINLRGRAVPVIDLSLRFGHAETAIGKRTSIVIVTINETVGGPVDGGEPVSQQIGVLVDAVNKVVTFSPGDIEPAPAFGAGIRADYISGMAKRDHSFVVVLDIGKVRSIRDIAAINSAMAEATGPGEA